MWNPFRSPLVEREMRIWMLAQADWLLTKHAHAIGFAKAQFLLPSRGFFISDGEKGHALAERIFAQIKNYAGVPALEVTLLEDPRSAGEHANRQIGVQPKSLPAGTFQQFNDRIEITYDSDLLKHPGDLICVLAHELAHAVLNFGSSAPSPTGEEFEELLTDFASVFLGFGVFGSYFRSDTRVLNREIVEEWKDFHMYYMNFNEFATATALFILTRNIDPTFALSEVRDDLRSKLKQAFRDWEAEATSIARIRQSISQLSG
jgi:hypothetical protein